MTSRIQVYCRIRQLGADSVVQAANDKVFVGLKDKAFAFQVDKVLTDNDQELTYQQTVGALMDDVLSGINCTIFTYGQTGSGKTFTMIGGANETRGLAPRAVQELFAKLKNVNDDTCEVKVALLEIYHEKLSDLLTDSTENLAIRQSATGDIWVENLTEVTVQGEADFMLTLQQGLRRRVVGAHKLNPQSSRSHFCCLIRVERRIKETNKVLVSKLSLVDLAGSEMAKKTDAMGKRLDEAKFINKSLSALSKVISTLSQAGSSQHIPFRDSKLTRLLQPSLSGNAKTIVVLTVSDSVDHLSETISTLKFGERARSIETRPQINSRVQSDNEKQHYLEEIAQYQRTIHSLRCQLASLQTVHPSEPVVCSMCRASASKESLLVGAVDNCVLETAAGLETRSSETAATSPALTDQETVEEEALISSGRKEARAEIQTEEDEEDDEEIKETELGGEEEEAESVELSDRCAICGLNQGEADKLKSMTGEDLGFLFHCDGNCGSIFHVKCVGLVGGGGQFALPEEEWFCGPCKQELHLVSGGTGTTRDSTHSESEEYDFIRRDRNRILMQWQQDKQAFTHFRALKENQMKEKDTRILQLEESQSEMNDKLDKQERENQLLRAQIEELRRRMCMFSSFAAETPVPIGTLDHCERTHTAAQPPSPEVIISHSLPIPYPQYTAEPFSDIETTEEVVENPPDPTAGHISRLSPQDSSVSLLSEHAVPEVSSSEIPDIGGSASRFLHPLRNRLSHLLALAQEEQESFKELKQRWKGRENAGSLSLRYSSSRTEESRRSFNGDLCQNGS